MAVVLPDPRVSVFLSFGMLGLIGSVWCIISKFNRYLNEEKEIRAFVYTRPPVGKI